MQSASQTGGFTLDLSNLTFSAKIDYITIHTTGKCALPELRGTARWSRKENHRKLSIHDPAQSDLAAIAGCFDNPRLAEIEVAVDIAPRGNLGVEERTAIIDALMIQLVAKGLNPGVVHEDLRFQFRGAFEGNSTCFRLYPFNKKLPAAKAQQLHGKRGDPLQVKSYPKGTDQGRQLPSAEHVARVEVRLSGDGLHHHGLTFVQDLLGFRYRKMLMPYFHHVRSARQRHRKVDPSRPLIPLMRAWKHRLLLNDLTEVGVGVVLRGGRHAGADVRLMRHTEVNNRIGQALLRLERRMKFVLSSDGR